MIKEQMALLQKLSTPAGIKAAFANFLNQAGISESVVKTAMTNKTLSDFNFFHSRAVVGLTTADFFNGSTSGVQTNLQSFIRPENEYAIITSIKVLEGANASVPATAWTEGISTADIMNGWFDLSLNGNVWLKRLPFTNFTEADEDAEAGIYDLIKPIFWGAQEEMKITATWPVALGTANQNLNIELIGLALV
jgi:hypothetical protein